MTRSARFARHVYMYMYMHLKLKYRTLLTLYILMYMRYEIFFTTVLPDNCAAGSGGVGLPDQSFLEEKGEFSDK